jgi:hypothetical protein
MFDTPLSLCGPLRRPVQMLADQSYQGAVSIHDDATADRLGFAAGPIEGPTHFSQLVPLCAHVWGRAWFERGCVSAHYRTVVVDGEEVRTFLDLPAEGARTSRAWAEKADGTPVLEASVGIDADPSTTLLAERMRRLRPPGDLLILADLVVGVTGVADERVRMGPTDHLGDLYPFTLEQKLAVITEPSPYYSDASASPWGRPVIPLEMVSVLSEYTMEQAGFPLRGPSVDMFADQEIRMIDGPLLVDETYVVRREVVALSESRRTESYWVRSRIFDAEGERLKAEVLLNHAHLKASYPGYADQP